MEDELAQLRAENAALRQQVAELTRLLAAAFERIAELEAQLNQRPPSSPPPVKAAAVPRLRYVLFDRSRAGAVVRRLLGGQVDSHLVRDFYAAYNWYPGPQQRSWAHLLRDLHGLAENHPADASVQAWVAAVRDLYVRARRLVPGEQTELHYALLVSETHTLGQQYAQQKGHPCWALAKRLLRHEAELFQFVLVPELEATNTVAERSLRPHVIARKISGGTRSPAGTQTRLGLASLFATWHLRQQNPFAACLGLLAGQPPLLGV